MSIYALFTKQDSRSFFKKLRTAYDSFRVSSRERRKRQEIPITALTRRPRQYSQGINVVFICHNDIHLIESFLLHYRAMGAAHFIVLDDASTDGTREFLLNQNDVDVWESPLRYSEARRGRQWREQLFEAYGKDRWYVNVDSDEFLVFADCETRSLSELVGVLERAGDKRLAAPMIDMYAGPGVRPNLTRNPPWTISDHFDSSGYDVSLDKRGVSVKGGPRGRRFDEDNELMKYPLIYWDSSCYFGSSPHRPLPYDRNFPKNWGALLHFKFFVNYKEKIAEAVKEKQHFGGAVHYQRLSKEIDENGTIDLYDEAVSTKFAGSQQLVDLGFVTPIKWSEPKSDNALTPPPVPPA
jgi:hypothetical protein